MTKFYKTKSRIRFRRDALIYSAAVGSFSLASSAFALPSVNGYIFTNNIGEDGPREAFGEDSGTGSASGSGIWNFAATNYWAPTAGSGSYSIGSGFSPGYLSITASQTATVSSRVDYPNYALGSTSDVSSWADTWEIDPTSASSSLSGQSGSLQLAFQVSYNYSFASAAGTDAILQMGGLFTVETELPSVPTVYSGSGSSWFVGDDLTFRYGVPFSVSASISGLLEVIGHGFGATSSSSGSYSLAASMAYYTNLKNQNGNPVPIGSVVAYEADDGAGKPGLPIKGFDTLPSSLTWSSAGATGDGTTWDIGTSQNWNNGSAAATYADGDSVNFSDANSGNYTVVLNAVVSPASTTFTNSVGNYTIRGTGAISGTGFLTIVGGGTVTLRTANNYSGGTVVSGGSLVLAVPGALPSGTDLTIAAGATVKANSLGTLLALNSFNNTGLLDLGNNCLIVHNGDLAALITQVQSGYNGGLWNGSTGIISSAAAADTTHLTAVGIIQNSIDGTPTGAVLHSTFEGQPVVDSDVLVKYTYYGDANLDGKVDGSDYSLIDNGYLNYLTGWFNGDFNYDGVVDGSDYTLIDNAYNAQGAQLTIAVATTTDEIQSVGAETAVPEPASFGMLATAAMLLGRRGRGR